jgi:hypothetical protein
MESFRDWNPKSGIYLIPTLIVVLFARRSQNTTSHVGVRTDNFHSFLYFKMCYLLEIKWLINIFLN